MAERSRLGKLPPETVLEDPARFQSRAEYPRDQMDSDLSDVKVFDDDCAGLISVWEDLDDQKLYVIDGHRRLRLAKRLHVPVVHVQFLKAERDADAFVRGVEISLAQWAFKRGDELLWAIASRRAAVERALHTRWLHPDGESANRLYKFYPDLGRRYSSFPNDHKEAEKSHGHHE
jgi:hypothetical protein